MIKLNTVYWQNYYSEDELIRPQYELFYCFNKLPRNDISSYCGHYRYFDFQENKLKRVGYTEICIFYGDEDAFIEMPGFDNVLNITQHGFETIIKQKIIDYISNKIFL